MLHRIFDFGSLIHKPLGGEKGVQVVQRVSCDAPRTPWEAMIDQPASPAAARFDLVFWKYDA